jgi:N-acetylneuraminic acid mutarotase
MYRTSRPFALFLIPIIALSCLTLLTVKTANAQSSNTASGELATANSWIQVAALSPSEGLELGAVSLNGRIYYFHTTVEQPNPNVNLYQLNTSVEQYDPNSNSWMTISDYVSTGGLPSFSNGVVAFQDKIYVIEAGSPTLIYDPSANSWATGNSIPESIEGGKAAVVGEKIYVIGGNYQTLTSNFFVIPSNSTHVYDPLTNSWSTMAPIPVPVTGCALAVLDNKIYVIGGGPQSYGTANSSSMVQIFDPAQNKWTMGVSLPNGVYGAAACATSGTLVPERIYVVGGNLFYANSAFDAYQSGGQNVRLNQVYDPENNSWSLAAPMTYPCGGGSLVNLNDTLFIIGASKFTFKYIPDGYPVNLLSSNLSSPTSVIQINNGNNTVNLALNGNITIYQMSNIALSTDYHKNSTTLAFTLSVQNGTVGFSNITIPSSAVSFGKIPSVSIDGARALNQNYTKNANFYYVWYLAEGGSNKVGITFTSSSNPSSISETNFWLVTLIIIIVASAVIVAVSVVLSHRKTAKHS